MPERRYSKRQKSFLRGCIYFNNRRSAVDCLVRDISAEGARLIFSDAVNVPDVVDLYIPQKEQTLRATVQWRHGDEVGVIFAANGRSKKSPATEDAMTERVAKLEREVAALRRLLRQLRSELPGAGESDAA